MRANILCAGLGSRFRPFSLRKPKSLIEIGGIPLIERTILQLLENDVKDIALVAGYKNECLMYLKEKYGVEIYVSTEYESKNNFSSVQLIRHRLDDCLIIDSDLYLHRAVVPLLDTRHSQFLSQAITCGSEWGIEHDENMRIIRVRKGVDSGYVMTGVSYWTGEGAKLLAEEVMHCGDDEFWEDAAIRIMEKTPVYITKAPKYATEVDSLFDLITAKLITADELAGQCTEGFLAEKLKGLTNDTYKVTLNQEKMVLRIPGEGTEKIISRSHEEYITSLLDGHGITPHTRFYSGGIKLMPFLENYRILEQETLTEEEVIGVAHTLRKLHSIKVDVASASKQDISIMSETKLYEDLTRMTLVDAKEKAFLYKIATQLDNDEPVICHRDLLLENILTDGKDIQLIDFEYACITSKYWDIVSFLTESRIEGKLRQAFLENYGDLDIRKVLEAEILIDYIWGLWGFYQSYYPYARERICMFHKHLKYFSESYASV